MRNGKPVARSQKPEASSQKPVGGQRSTVAPRASRSVFLLATGFWLLASHALAPTPLRADPPTQEDVLRSISQNVSERGDNGTPLAVMAAVAGVIVLLVVVGQRRARSPKPRPLHSHAKLMKEVLRSVPLKPAELKQLKLLVQEARARGGNEPAPESPLTLVLCPSLLVKAARPQSDKVNRRVVAGLAKKLVGQ